MGAVKNMGLLQYPKQGEKLNKKVEVCFNYDTANIINGIIIRDDAEAPYQEIIRLDDGRYVLSTECQYRLA